ncbi:MAG: HEAT repeat domain-containing protein [Leptospira sp.]|nr:HEAT repeat domain-containing protein [Leptospira sp.]
MNQSVAKFLLLFNFLFLFLLCGPNSQESPKENEVDMFSEKTYESLLADLKSEDPFLRGQATIELGNRNVNAAIPFLREHLKDPNPGVRAGAAIALGELKDTKSTKIIVKLMNSDIENPKDVYLDALSRMGDPSAKESIYPLLEDENPTLRLQVVEALVQVRGGSVGGQILSLAKKNQDREKDKTYAMALGKLKVRESESYLKNLSKIQDESPTLAAAYLALGRIQAKNSFDVLVSALSNPYSKGKENASLALIEIGNPNIVSSVFQILEREIDEETKMYATDVLCNIPSIESAKLAFGLLKGNKQALYGSGAKIVGRQKYKEASPRLIQLLSDPKSLERDSFAEALGWIGDREAIPVLRKVLLSGDKEGPYGSAWALGILGAKEAVPDLLTVLDGGDPKLISYALEALGSIADPTSLTKLKSFLKDRPKMAPQILSSIGLIPGEEARLVLEESAKSRDADIHRPALEEISKRKDTKSIPLLLEFVNGDSPEKRKMAYYALAEITGQKFRTPKEWNDWAKINQR